MDIVINGTSVKSLMVGSMGITKLLVDNDTVIHNRKTSYCYIEFDHTYGSDTSDSKLNKLSKVRD